MEDWQSIVSRHQAMVWQTVHRLVGQEADAADCFQETFLAAVEYARKQPVKNWAGLLKRIAITKALDRLRHRYRQAGYCQTLDETLLPAGDEPGPADRLQNTELAERLRQALAELPAQQAEVFCLRFVEGASYRQIARQMGVKTNAIGVLLHRGRTRLKALLEGVLVGEDK